MEWNIKKLWDKGGWKLVAFVLIQQVLAVLILGALHYHLYRGSHQRHLLYAGLAALAIIPF